MATIHKKRPDGLRTSWTWENAEGTIAFHHELAGGEGADMAGIMRAGAMSQDVHIDKVVVSLENAPSAGSTVTVTVDNVASTITVNVADTATFGSSTTNHFDLDVSAEDLTILISATAGTAAGCVTIFVFYHDITIT
ncbi:unnamed protein product [marine sediment metagenome]|uniref:Uncharacterized protein n=1 Tax=marine sediment metagenome TaxID=412755 RepID=X1V6V1_9ZZZZ